MLQLGKGDYFGLKRSVFDFKNIIITNTETALKEAPWHYHENAHFSYFIKGDLQEINKKNSFDCSEGALIYHHTEDPHCNKNGGFVNNLNIEFLDSWFKKFEIKDHQLYGTSLYKHPSLTSLFSQLYKEVVINDEASHLTIEGLLLQAFGIILRSSPDTGSGVPKWVVKMRDYLHQQDSVLNLTLMAHELNIHPTYLSRAFPKYFHCSFGDYVRKLKLQKAALLLKDKRQSLTNIAYECEFSDQSHFIRCFKRTYNMTPLQYRKSILNVN